MRWPVLLSALLAACGPGRDPTFHSIVQFGVVNKLARGDGFVYFVEIRELSRVPITGGAVERLRADVNDFAATDGHAYAATSAGVVHFALSASGAVISATEVDFEPTWAIAADANGVSWLTCDRLVHADRNGLNVVSTPAPGPCSNAATRLTLDSSTAYGSGAGGQWYAARSGGPTVPLANENCMSIAAGGGWLYCSHTAAGLTRLSPARKEVEQVLPGQVRSFAIGERRIYAAVGQDLISSPRNSTQQEVLGTYAAISAVAVDATWVYLVNTEGDRGLLLRTAL